jgi:hypothetical protein
MIAIEKIGYLFEQIRGKGWNFSGKPEENWLNPTYKGTFENLEVYITFSEQWVCLQSIAADSSRGKHKELLYEYLLKLNDRTFLTKFSLDKQGRIMLMSEFPSASFDSNALNDMLEAVERYMRKYYDPFINALPNQYFEIFLPPAEMEEQHKAKTRGVRMLTDEKIKSFFLGVFKKDWYLPGDPDGCNWQALYKGRFGDFDVFVTFTGGWTYFQSPMMRQPVINTCKLALYEYLLRLNSRMFTGKFGLGKDNLVVLTVEFPTGNLNFNLFIEGVEAMSCYLDKFFYEVNLLALEPEIADLTIGKDLDWHTLTNPRITLKLKIIKEI